MSVSPLYIAAFGVVAAALLLRAYLAAQRKPTLRIKALAIFPIKSCRPFDVKSARITRRGFEHDRTFMLISPDKEKGTWDNHHIARNPRNALIQPTIEGDECVVYSPHNEKPFRFPLRPIVNTSVPMIKIVMHTSAVEAYDMGQHAEDWFTIACGLQTKLVYIGESSSREVLGSVKPGENFEGLTFSDCAAYLIGTERSLDAMSEKLGRPMDSMPLRMNIQLQSVDGKLQPWEEDYWAGLKVNHQAGGTSSLVLTANCARCASLDIDYNTGIPQKPSKGIKMPLSSITGTRRVDKGMRHSPVFGRYAFSNDEGNIMQVGDSLSVTKKNKEHTVFQWPSLSY